MLYPIQSPILTNPQLLGIAERNFFTTGRRHTVHRDGLTQAAATPSGRDEYLDVVPGVSLRFTPGYPRMPRRGIDV